MFVDVGRWDAGCGGHREARSGLWGVVAGLPAILGRSGHMHGRAADLNPGV